jgi:DNA polymerase-4
MHALGVHTIGQLAALPEQLLADHLGATGRHVWQLAHGEDERGVVPDREAKSISTETTFGEDIGDRDALRAWLLDLTDHLASRLRHAGVRARGVEVKIRSSDFRTRHRAQALPEATNATDALWRAALEVFEQGLTGDLLPVRLLGVGATRLTRDAAVQGHLFDGGLRQRSQSLDRAVDAIRGQFGDGAIRRGSALNRSEESGP